MSVPSVTTPAQPHPPTPFELGMMDARAGELCVPEAYYTRRDQCRDYCFGFEHVKPGQLATCYYVRQEEIGYV